MCDIIYMNSQDDSAQTLNVSDAGVTTLGELLEHKGVSSASAVRVNKVLTTENSYVLQDGDKVVVTATGYKGNELFSDSPKIS